MAYESRLRTTKIEFTSRASVKIRDNFYTVGATECREIPEGTSDSEIDWEEEKKLLWEEVNRQIDDQVDEIKETFLKK